MNIQELTYQYCHRPNKDKAYLVLHGMSEGIDSDFIRSIYLKLSSKDETVLAFNFPYLDKGLKPSEDLKYEVAAVGIAAQFLEAEGNTQLTIVAKSLGGTVVSRWLKNYTGQLDVTVNILGFVLGNVSTVNLRDRLNLVIQGENDRYGNTADVRDELENNNVVARVIEIGGADHSYRNVQGEPVYQKDAVSLLLTNS